MSAINFGIIASGGMARSWARGFEKVPDAALAGTWDPNPAQAQGLVEEFGGQVYPSLEGLLEDPAIEAVVVVSPNPFHAEQTIAAAHAGKHVITEKPMALTLEDCDAMIATCQEAGVLLMVGQVLRYITPFGGCLEMVRRGDLGKLWGANVTRLGTWTGVRRTTWRGNESWTKGMLWEIYVHRVDSFWLLGRPENVLGTSRAHRLLPRASTSCTCSCPVRRDAWDTSWSGRFRRVAAMPTRSLAKRARCVGRPGSPNSTSRRRGRRKHRSWRCSSRCRALLLIWSVSARRFGARGRYRCPVRKDVR